jgi:subtilisin family serine protease
MATGNGNEGGRKLNELVAGGTKEYLIAAKRGPQAQLAGQISPLSAHQFQATLTSVSSIKVKKTIPRHGAAAPMSMFAGEATDVVVADIEENAAPALKASANASGMIIEENEPLSYAGMTPLFAPGYQSPAYTSANLAPRKIQLRVTGKGDQPLAAANVMLQGDGFMQSGKTNAKGDLTLDLWTLGDGPAKYVWVKPKADHWDRYIASPNLEDSSINVIRLQSFEESIPGFPDAFASGWGQKAMGVASLPDFAKGKGVKIAVIDSGADTSHPLLSHIGLGLDASTEAKKDGWKIDTIGHGSHVVGVIAAGGNATGFRGFAPEAEIHVIKVFPGGYDSLIQALNYCVAQRIDVVNMSLGGTELSVTVEQALQEATIAGTACIVAAGNSGDAVKYPASSPNALAVAAIGNTVSTRNQSWGYTQILSDSVATDGTYAAKFSCHGPEIRVCAPGVAIVSTVPGGFGTDDGTSMASPHVTGLAALMLAHHPLFRTTFAARNQGRVAALFSMLRDMCQSYAFPDGRAGSGLPRVTDQIAAEFQPGVDPAASPTGPTNTVEIGSGGPALHTLSAFPGDVGRSLGSQLASAANSLTGQQAWNIAQRPQQGLFWTPPPGYRAFPLGGGQGYGFYRG